MPQIQLQRVEHVAGLCEAGRKDVCERCELGLNMLVALEKIVRACKPSQCTSIFILEGLDGALGPFQQRLRM